MQVSWKPTYNLVIGHAYLFLFLSQYFINYCLTLNWEGGMPGMKKDFFAHFQVSHNKHSAKTLILMPQTWHMSLCCLEGTFLCIVRDNFWINTTDKFLPTAEFRERAVLKVWHSGTSSPSASKCGCKAPKYQERSICFRWRVNMTSAQLWLHMDYSWRAEYFSFLLLKETEWVGKHLEWKDFYFFLIKINEGISSTGPKNLILNFEVLLIEKILKKSQSLLLKPSRKWIKKEETAW